MQRRAVLLYPAVMALVTALLAVGLRRRTLVRILRQRFRDRVRATVKGPSSHVDSRDAITAVSKSYLDALLCGDALGYAGAFHDDAIVIPGTGTIRRGRSAIQSAIDTTFAKLRFLEAEMATVDFRLSGETAIETGRYRFVVFSYLEPHAVPRTTAGRYAIVWKRVAGGWRISLDVGQPESIEV